MEDLLRGSMGCGAKVDLGHGAMDQGALVDLDRGAEGQSAMAALDCRALVDLDRGAEGQGAMAALDHGAMVDLVHGAIAGQDKQSFHQRTPPLLEGLWRTPFTEVIVNFYNVLFILIMNLYVVVLGSPLGVMKK